MASSADIDLSRVAHDVGIELAQVQSTTELLDAGNTVPFITRYRKDQTGGLDETQILAIAESLSRLRGLEQRKQTILRSIESQGKLTEQLTRDILRANSPKRLEDLYLPFRPKKQTLATQAHERGLGPLAEEILRADPACADLDARAADFVNADKEVPAASDALLGAGFILAERFSERADVRQRARKIFRRTGKLVSTRCGEANEKLANQYHDYLNYREPLSRIPPHRVLAINRGERANVVKVKIEAAFDIIEREAIELLVPVDHPHAEFLRGCVRDGLARLVLPSLEREARRDLTEKAESRAVDVFARNLTKLLMQPPVRGRRVLAIDPGFKNGCKVAAIDEFGAVLAVALFHVIGNDERKAESRARVAELIRTHDLSIIAIGNGTACRETEELAASLIAEELADRDLSYVVVNEAGASVYSTSALGREELPNFDAMQRSAISIGRRLQDPLSELVKIDPASIGVGLYQHDAKAKHLRDSLDGVVQSCVSFVGVDVNTASPALLRYVSGMNQLTARRVYEHRQEHGPFRSRQQLLDVPGLGEVRFVQAAGFLKIEGGEDPLDATWIHPESYSAAEKLLTRFEVEKSNLASKDVRAKLVERARGEPADVLAAELDVGKMLLSDMIEALARPGRDPREDLPPPVFRKGIVKLDDLTDGMELTGTVLNVVDFGVFVDIGLSDSGLVHVSQLANQYIRDPHDVVSVGDKVKVWVTKIDKERRRVGLTMIEPGTEVKPPPKKPSRRGRSAGSAAARRGTSSDNAEKRSGRRPASQHTARPRVHQKVSKKPIVPITKEMEEGSEPMRTFGDLLQYHQKKSIEPDDQQSS